MQNFNVSVESMKAARKMTEKQVAEVEKAKDATHVSATVRYEAHSHHAEAH